MSWWDRSEAGVERDRPARSVPRPDESVYETRPRPPVQEEGWHQVGELDPTTGAWRGMPDWSMGWHPFPGQRLLR